MLVPILFIIIGLVIALFLNVTIGLMEMVIGGILLVIPGGRRGR